jgi:hypothetical protein
VVAWTDAFPLATLCCRNGARFIHRRLNLVTFRCSAPYRGEPARIARRARLSLALGSAATEASDPTTLGETAKNNADGLSANDEMRYR